MKAYQQNWSRTQMQYLLVLVLILSPLAVFAPQSSIAHAATPETSPSSLPSNVTPAQESDNNAEIVYLDDDGFVRVLDAYHTGDTPAIQWSSPEGDWDHFDLGDFNNDGDLEIVVVGNVGDRGLIAIYDPVVASGDSDTEINGVPWTKLYQAEINDGAAYLVKAGNFDD
ncbi:MAG: hypothetical protein AAF639_05590, partial [Chloroflexota bacterium]